MDCTFDLATEADDPALRHLLATNPLPGSVTVTYEREPNYFLGCPVMGHFYQVPVARCRTSGNWPGLPFVRFAPVLSMVRSSRSGIWANCGLTGHFAGRG